MVDMFDIKEFPSLNDAFDENMIQDIDHILIRHSYPQGKLIVSHIHSDADEFVIASKGHFKISSLGESLEFNLKGDKVIVVYYPAGRDHGLEVIGEWLDYFVLRKTV